MGQYYKTSKPTFVDDFMYKPPYELFKEVIQTKDKLVNDQIDSASALDKHLEMETLDFDTERFQDKKSDYLSKINDLTEKIKKDPINYSKYGQDIVSLQKELMKDLTVGELGVMRQDYSKYSKFLEDHKKFREKDPSRFNAGLNTFYENARKARTDQTYSGYKGYKDSVWDSEQLIESKDFQKKFVDSVKALRPDVVPIASTQAKGGYIFKVKGTNEVLSEDRVQDLMAQIIQQEPNIQEYLAQSERIGLPFDYKAHLDFAKNFAYQKQTKEVSQSGDPNYLEAVRQANRERMEDIKQRNKYDLIDYKNGTSPDSLSNAEQHNNTAINLFGNSLLSIANKAQARMTQGYSDQELNEAGISRQISKDQVIQYGIGNLIREGIIKEAKAKSIDDRIQKLSKSIDAMGNKQMFFTFPKDVIVTTP